MPANLSDPGEEFIQKYVFSDEVSRPATTLTVGLYHDATDALTEAEDLADITTEPSDGNYARQSVDFGATDMLVTDDNGDWQVELSEAGGPIIFDVTSTTGLVDAWFVVITFQSVDKGDGTPTDHLFFCGLLDQEYDLSNLDQLQLSNVAAKLS